MWVKTRFSNCSISIKCLTEMISFSKHLIFFEITCSYSESKGQHKKVVPNHQTMVLKGSWFITYPVRSIACKRQFRRNKDLFLLDSIGSVSDSFQVSSVDEIAQVFESSPLQYYPRVLWTFRCHYLSYWQCAIYAIQSHLPVFRKKV